MNAVAVVPHDPEWGRAFEREADAIRHALHDVPIVLHHIGSTSIPGILAKPIIDLLGVVDDLEATDRESGRLRDLGYEVMGPFGIEGRRYFRKFDAAGRRTHHLHVFEAGSPHIERHLAFRDFLRSHPAKANEYSALKNAITSESGVSWERYVEAKGPFVDETEKLALAWYRRKPAGAGVR
jgi:GrpB-like predicted nucleotidyltransferase (UPF0157 family)